MDGLSGCMFTITLVLRISLLQKHFFSWIPGYPRDWIEILRNSRKLWFFVKNLFYTEKFERGRFSNHDSRLGFVSQGKIKVNEQKYLSAVLCAEHFYFQYQHLFSCVDPLLLCYRVLNMGRVVLFWCFSVIFKSLIANLTRGIATLQNKILTVLRVVRSLLNFIG